VQAGDTYYIFVDGYNGEAGPFQLDVEILPAFCGNGHVEGVEQCDDGATLDGDGCNHLCQFEPAGPEDLCPGTLVTLLPSGGQWVGSASGSTANMTPNYAGTCGSSQSAPDAVYRVVPPVAGTMTLTLPPATTSFDSVLYARTGVCDGPGVVAIDCADEIGNGEETIQFAVQPNTSYWVFVDGYSSAAGTYTLQVVLAP